MPVIMAFQRGHKEITCDLELLRKKLSMCYIEILMKKVHSLFRILCTLTEQSTAK
jgi:hypothetical protein